MPSFRERSRLEVTADNSLEHINAGSLQRIADATEKMASNWSALTSERDRYKQWYAQSKAENVRLGNVIRSLRGAVTRAKRGVEKEPSL